MSFTNRRRAASTLAEKVEEADHTDADRSIVRAILLPISESAAYSLRLPENSQLVSRLGSLPSPSNSSEDEDAKLSSLSRRLKRGRTSTRRESQLAIVFKQSRDTEKFTLGASRDRDVVLKHPDQATEDCCWINSLHLELYPDPDYDTLTLYNRSTSSFTIKSLASTVSAEGHILPDQEARLDCGSWQVNLGNGLDFQIRIAGKVPCNNNIHHDWSPISSKPRRWLAKPLRKTNRSISRRRLTQETAVREEASFKRASPTRERGESVAGPELLVPLSNAYEILRRTTRSEVYKTIRNGIVFAVKTCRKSAVSFSAETWRNELRILKHLNHPSIVKLINYNALNLSIMLEYVGPDLARLINEEDISKLSTVAQHRIWIDISRGLQYIHSIGIIHLDVKPQNILLGKDNRAVLCDFELSVEGVVETKSNGGTPPYLPPEYLYAGCRGMPSDVFAFGVTMLFVFGLIPLPRGNWRIAAIYRDPNVQAEMVDWLEKVQQVAEDVPESLLLLRQMLDGDWKKRITAQQMVEDLTALESRELEAAPEVLVPLLC